MEYEPTDIEIGICIDVLEWLRKYTQDNEPHARALINSCNDVILSMPESAGDLENQS